jgi:hypothetical protein
MGANERLERFVRGDAFNLEGANESVERQNLAFPDK